MKRIVTLLLAAGLVFGAFGGAHAADIKAKGYWALGFGFTDSLDYYDKDKGGSGGDTFNAHQRFRTQIDVVANENLSGVVYFEIGHQDWGTNDGALGADGKVVKVRRSYIDWTVPQTDLKVRMGIQGLALPGATFGSSPILDDDVAALTLSYAFNDMVSATAFWARPYDTAGDKSDADGGKNAFDEVDIFGLAVPVTLDGFKVTPYAAYASAGKDVNGSDSTKYNGSSWGAYTSGMLSVSQLSGLGNQDSETNSFDAWWGGVAFEMSKFDPFSLKADFSYGAKEADVDASERSGWLLSAKAAYKLGMVTPGLFAWYGSGEDDDINNGSERMPSVSPQSWAPTSFGFPGSVYYDDTNFGLNGAGSWALGLELADISFIENLSHVFRVAYMKGTNDADLLKKNAGLVDEVTPAQGAVFLTNEDSAWEVNFDTTYKIYENLSLVAEMGYIKLDLDEETWGNANSDTSDAKKLAFYFIYEF
ncbi:outer membrane homotrimeric porin [Nitratidesulfovibrio vulgaris]|uniref:Outer membrane porin n=2 Tax=Nitratidesulfovibrio vulgaris TaxID=881 RepID=Q72DY2_NITV2|nr:outer membrane homotrimeric porin [Nitratidesulfovibrio vulgaris]GEB79834.1 hypothetical protein DDE01_12490 [Desulfovibrio desulfuricans]AAS95277.1 conserved hypothetical protein [Nitratidesulfovibrio vulgaris str. Hildenborough]ABM29193.1 conserved hypothetical protein [Nitratidesulfovibrio vulgaris DP4]ADP85898.1 hypothetical protein Deval_0734 [Nitratidesulfovibrio vulgaris RCH1]WCB46061.1 outer membrane homotrimeric porin [Nitratidesulfovibrio vulgaris]